MSRLSTLRFKLSADKIYTRLDKAAQLAYGLTENHGFVDGNKRAAIHSMMVYLLLNDFDIIADEDELFQVSMGLAAGKISSSALSKWLKHNSIKICKGES